VAGMLWDKFGPVAAFVFASATASIVLGVFIIYEIKLQKMSQTSRFVL
jgi:hypothetical protein